MSEWDKELFVKANEANFSNFESWFAWSIWIDGYTLETVNKKDYKYQFKPLLDTKFDIDPIEVFATTQTN